MSPVTGPGEAATVAVKVTACPVTSPMPGTELDSVTVAGLLLPHGQGRRRGQRSGDQRQNRPDAGHPRHGPTFDVLGCWHAPRFLALCLSPVLSSSSARRLPRKWAFPGRSDIRLLRHN